MADICILCIGPNVFLELDFSCYLNFQNKYIMCMNTIIDYNYAHLKLLLLNSSGRKISIASTKAFTHHKTPNYHNP